MSLFWVVVQRSRRTRPWAARACLLLSLLLAACGSGDDGGRPVFDVSGAADSARVRAARDAAAAAGAVARIRPDGIDVARIGMTIGELRAALPQGTSLGAPLPFMVDVAGLPVAQGADTLFWVLIPDGTTPADDLVIDLLATSNGHFRTLEGLGPGMTLGEAATVAGAPTLSWNPDDESREYAAFPGVPPSILLRTRGGRDDLDHAGIYDGDARSTSLFDAYGRIMMILVTRPRSTAP